MDFHGNKHEYSVLAQLAAEDLQEELSRNRDEQDKSLIDFLSEIQDNAELAVLESNSTGLSYMYKEMPNPVNEEQYEFYLLATEALEWNESTRLLYEGLCTYRRWSGGEPRHPWVIEVRRYGWDNGFEKQSDDGGWDY